MEPYNHLTSAAGRGMIAKEWQLAGVTKPVSEDLLTRTQNKCFICQMMT